MLLKRKATKNRVEWFEALRASGFMITEGEYSRRPEGSVAYTLFENPKASQLTLLFHGTGNDQIFTWQPLIESLLESGQCVLTFDLDGHGRKSSSRLSVESFWTAGDDLKAFLHTSGYDGKQLNAVGYSLGGLFLLNLASESSLSWNRLVFVGVPTHVALSLRFMISELTTLFHGAFYEQWKSFGLKETLPAFGQFRRQSFPIRMPMSATKAYPELVTDLFAARPPLSLLPKLSHKSLVIFGRRDQLAPPSAEVHWRKANPAIQISVIDRANHFLLPFVKPTIKAITEWIRHEPPPAKD